MKFPVTFPLFGSFHVEFLLDQYRCARVSRAAANTADWVQGTINKAGTKVIMKTRQENRYDRQTK